MGNKEIKQAFISDKLVYLGSFCWIFTVPLWCIAGLIYDLGVGIGNAIIEPFKKKK